LHFAHVNPLGDRHLYAKLTES